MRDDVRFALKALDVALLLVVGLSVVASDVVLGSLEEARRAVGRRFESVRWKDLRVLEARDE